MLSYVTVITNRSYDLVIINCHGESKRLTSFIGRLMTDNLTEI